MRVARGEVKEEREHGKERKVLKRGEKVLPGWGGEIRWARLAGYKVERS